MRNPMVISTAGADGPGGFALNRKCTLTLVLAKDGKVVRSMGYTDTGAHDVPAMETELSNLTGTLPKDASGLRELLAKRYPNSDAELIALTADLLVKARRADAENPPDGRGPRRAQPSDAQRQRRGTGRAAAARGQGADRSRAAHSSCARRSTRRRARRTSTRRSPRSTRASAPTRSFALRRSRCSSWS